MTLNAFIAMLTKLRDSDPDAKDMQVFYRHGASGDCGPLGSAHISDAITDEGPFDIDDDPLYISIYAGN